MNALKKVLAFILIASVSVIVIGSVMGVFSKSYAVKGSGKIKKVGIQIFWDIDETLPVTSIDWGLLEPSEAVNVDVYIKNVSNLDGMLDLNVINWTPPEAINDMILTWNYVNGTILIPNEVISVTFTLTIAPEPTVEDFAFDMIITITAI